MRAVHCLMPSLIALSAAVMAAAAQAQHGHSDFCDPTAATPKPVLSAGDFDVDGIITEKDVGLIKDQVEAGSYIALFDRNADQVLDERDIDMTVAEIGRQSGRLDQQLARAFQGTKHYRDQSAAVREGFIPLTQSFYGHGAHWIRNPRTGTQTGAMDYTFEPGAPEGLNYDEEGHLWGVFYYVGESGTRPDGTKYPPGEAFRPLSKPPEGFAGDEDVWHHHAGACVEGLDYERPTLDASELTFREGVSPKQCLPVTDGRLDIRSTKWTPKIHMVHAWIYELNPCGTFAGAHPELAETAAHPDTARPHGKIDTLDPHPDFPFTGGTLCAWLDEVDQAPEFCVAQQ